MTDQLPEGATAKYFQDLATFPILTPDEELETAKLVVTLELDLWVLLLSYLPTQNEVLQSIQTPELARSLGVARRAATQYRDRGFTGKLKFLNSLSKVAEKLRENDPDRELVTKAEKVVLESSKRQALKVKILGHKRKLQEAKNRFVAANLRLVVSIARRYNKGRMPLIDLIQEGNLGLIKAVERFDHRRGYRFSTYASWWIRHAISRALADKGRAVRIPVHMLDTLNKVSKASAAISAQMGREPVPEEMEGIVTPTKLAKLQSGETIISEALSLDRPLSDQDNKTFVDLLEDPGESPYEQTVNTSWAEAVRKAMVLMNPIEAWILRLRFGFDNDTELTLKEIGERYGLSRERIRQLQEQALHKMKVQLQEWA